MNGLSVSCTTWTSRWHLLVVDQLVSFPLLVPRYVYLPTLHHNLFVLSLIAPSSPRAQTLRHNMKQVATQLEDKNCHFVNGLTSQDISTTSLEHLFRPGFRMTITSTPLVGLGRFFQFPNINTVRRTSWTCDQPVARPLPTRRTTQTQNKRTKTSMPRVGFEATIPAFEDSSCLRPHGHDRRIAITHVGFMLHLV
jgi:hypothetical protein